MELAKTIRIKQLMDEDFVNYRKPAMFIGTAFCDGKCCKEAGLPLSVCQNESMYNAPILEFSIDKLCKRYLNNDITRAIVFGGLEPFMQYQEVYSFVRALRDKYNCRDDIVIYTGYYSYEIAPLVDDVLSFDNIIVKWGRYIPGKKRKYDHVLGVTLASDNQYVVSYNSENNITLED